MTVPAAVAVDPLGAVTIAVDDLLEAFLADRSADVARLDPSLAQLTDEIRLLVAAGGKRLRPAFVHWGHVAAGGETALDAVLPAAAAVELLHTFALLHDDVMDRSAVRRGRPAAHAALADGHRRESPWADSRWFGVSGAILAGDLTHVWADELLERSAATPATLDRARRAFTVLRTEVIAGQFLDLRLADLAGAGEEDAMRVALLKSARYTATRPLELGAALVEPAGAVAPEVAGALIDYGDAVGTAFQLRDDVLGLFGDPAATGKGRLDDLREGKRTLLVLRALDRVDGVDHDTLAAALGNPELDERDASRCCEIVERSGALDSVEALIADRHAAAVDALDALHPAARAPLAAMADITAHRSS